MPNFIVRIKCPAGSVVMLPPAWSDVSLFEIVTKSTIIYYSVVCET